ncbi:MAG TPA: ATP-dependent Clp protease proteolytic subunit [Micromonosporaceae bacterium]
MNPLPVQVAHRWGVPPDQPRQPWPPPGPPAGPGGSGADLSPWLEERLFDQRIVVLSGPLNGPNATRAAAALMTLDALAPDPVRLHMSAPDGDFAAAFSLVDAIDAMRAPVHAVVTGKVGGAALAVLAAAERRLAYRHATLHVCEPATALAEGTADEVTAAAGQYLRELEELADRIAAITEQPRSRIEDDLSAGRVLNAVQAREYGLIDEIIGERPGQP